MIEEYINDQKNKSLTNNAIKYLSADFFWNFGRTLPHAILTVYLLSVGTSLSRIALLQSIFMITAMVAEFPSGVIADYFSRKVIYLVSMFSILISYLLIGFFSSNFYILAAAYLLYGLSVALKSGTLEAEIVLEYRKYKLEIKPFSVMTSYIMSASSLLGGFLGSLLYSIWGNKIYIVSILFFACSIMIGSMCYFEKSEAEGQRELKGNLGKEIKNGLSLIKENLEMRIIIVLFALTALFIQPFFQYWQVLYQEKEIPVAYFGMIYIAFQLCNIAAAYIYKRLKETPVVYNTILVMIPFVFALGIVSKQYIILFFPVAVMLFYIYNQHLDVVRKNVSTEKYMSSYFSLIGTVENIASMVILFLMAIAIKGLGIEWAYFTMFAVFSIISLAFLCKFRDKLYLTK